MKTKEKPGKPRKLAAAKSGGTTTRSAQQASAGQVQDEKLQATINYLPAEYRAAVAGIPDHRVRNRVRSILCDARMIIGASDEDVARQLAQPAEELHKIAVRSPAVRDMMVAIVEDAVKPLFLAVLCLAARVVGRLITEDRLDLAQTARAFRGLAKIWFDISDNRFSWMQDAELKAIFEQMGKDIVFALQHVAEAMPELVIDACVRKRKQLPGIDVSGLCSAVGLAEKAVRAGLIDEESEFHLCMEEEEEEAEEDEYEEYEEEQPPAAS